MSLKPWLEKLPSLWRLALLMTLIVAVSILMILSFVRFALTQDMQALNRRQMSESLMQQAAVYKETGTNSVQKLLHALPPPERYGMRLTSGTGDMVAEDMPDHLRTFPWPEKAGKPLSVTGDFDILEVTVPEISTVLYVGAIRLWDGKTLWLGRTDVQSQRHVANIERHLWFAGLTAALIAFLPVVWYIHDVLRPIQAFTRSAERMRLPGSSTRLRAPGAIPELKALASVVNTSMDQIQALTRELQSTNDFLAHELRTPLARIRGNLEHLHDETDNEKAMEAAARGLEEIDRATQLVQTLLTIRAGDHAALRLHRQVTSLDDLLSKLVELFVPAAEDRRLTLTLVPGLSLTLNMDREILTQAVSNLLDNALAYTPAGGHITVRWQVEGTGAIISVDDNGPGMHPDETETIWGRYVRGTAAKPKSSGMGLGLSLVRSIAMAHGGYAGAQNREGGGATFWIYIPGA